jgi:hypothetical protein
LAKCPHRKKPVPSWAQPPKGKKFNLPLNLYNHANSYPPYCPIVVSPNFLPYGTPHPFPPDSYSPTTTLTAKGVVSVTTPRGNVGQRRPMLHWSPRPILCRPGPPIH